MVDFIRSKTKTVVTLVFCSLLYGYTLIDANAQFVTLKGEVTDRLSTEALPSAHVSVDDGRTIIPTNRYGSFTLRLTPGSHDLRITYMGYAPQRLSIHVRKDTSLQIALAPLIRELDAVNVSGITTVQDVIPGRVTLNVAQIKNQPALGGEADVLKALQYLPGVSAPVEGTSNLSVRGGSYDQTLVLLDGAPVYNPGHALGFFSIFNIDALKDISLYKGLIPSQYGNRLSSVVDISMREGNSKQRKTDVGVGLLASRLTLEGPLSKNTSFIVSGRYSYAGHTLNALGSVLSNYVFSLRNFQNNNVISFYDLNAKINFKDRSGKDRFFFSAYNGHDKFNYYLLSSSTLLKWGNTTGAFRWNHTYTNRLFSTIRATYGNYNYNYILVNDRRNFDWMARQSEMSVKADFQYAVSPGWHSDFGLQVAKNSISPGSVSPITANSSVLPFKMSDKHSVLTAVYTGNQIDVNEKVKVYLGLRANVFSLLGPTRLPVLDAGYNIIDTLLYDAKTPIKSFATLEPRLSATLLMANNQSVKFAYSNTAQFFHLLTNSSAGLPTDIWMPSNPIIKPQKSHQISLGYYKTVSNDRYTLTVEGYGKAMSSVIDFIDNANLFLNQTIETQIRSGKGSAYGVETRLERNKGRLTGWVSYTWAHSRRKIEGINQGLWYPTRDDRRHNLALTGNMILKKDKLFLSSNFSFNSGAPITVPIGTFIYQGVVFNYYSDRNGVRLKPYHRLDLSLTFRKRKNRHERNWIVGIYNVYGRNNAFTIVQQPDFYDLTRSQVVALSVFGIVPSITYTLSL
ncbi:TonB-dependent receptor [Larkinella sp. GY13]|uniref:TonB-dependent receptor n=1 Tax=Larkinella sp. GY13 TaxID=3453720 RepID=UPI003EEDDADB